jgi:hypothetical protein
MPGLGFILVISAPTSELPRSELEDRRFTATGGMLVSLSREMVLCGVFSAALRCEMNRRSLLGLGLGTIALASISPAHATIPEFSILIQAQMLVVSFSTASENQGILSKIPTIEIRQRLTEYLSHRLKQENLPIVAADMGGYLAPPAGVLPQNVVSVFVRADITTKTVGQREIIAGALSVFLRREVSQSLDSYLSHKPMTFFVVDGDHSDLENEVIKAAQDQLEKCVIGPLISLRR